MLSVSKNEILMSHAQRSVVSKRLSHDICRLAANRLAATHREIPLKKVYDCPGAIAPIDSV
jgi:hypothetical protein